MNSAGERLYNGLIKENPTFVLMLGMCPTLAVTTSAMNGLGMGLTTMVVLALSNMLISLLRKVIPNRVRIPAFIVIIASFVTIVQLLLEAYLPDLNKSLGVYIPLIVVNCIILGRAESYAYFNPPVASLFDGVGMGLGFTFGLTSIGVFREVLGAGELFGYAIMPESFEPIRIFGLAPGAFFVLATLVAFQNYIKAKREKAGKDASKIGSGCSEDCMNCGQDGCAKRFYDDSSKKAQETKAAKEVVSEAKTAEVTAVSEEAVSEKVALAEAASEKATSEDKSVTDAAELPSEKKETVAEPKKETIEEPKEEDKADTQTETETETPAETKTETQTGENSTKPKSSGNRNSGNHNSGNRHSGKNGKNGRNGKNGKKSPKKGGK